MGNPSCLQTTRASLSSQESSHTVPQELLKHTSTRPSSSVRPPTSLTSVLLQTRLTKTHTHTQINALPFYLVTSVSNKKSYWVQYSSSHRCLQHSLESHHTHETLECNAYRVYQFSQGDRQPPYLHSLCAEYKSCHRILFQLHF